MRDEFYQSLASQYRREIIKLLKWENLSAGKISEHSHISQPSISLHLDVLKRAEIVTAARKANRIIYSLNRSVIEEMYIQVSDLLSISGAGKTEPAHDEAENENENNRGH